MKSNNISPIKPTLLLDGIGPEIPYEDFPHRMANLPLTQINLNNVNLIDREKFLNLSKSHFIPTTYSQKIASAIQLLIVDRYTQLDFDSPRYSRFIFDLGRQSENPRLASPQYDSPAQGMIIQGITGLGKSTIVQQYLSLLPSQFILYTKGEMQRYKAARQITWLKVQIGDGSRLGFLLAILASIDDLVGTDYHNQYDKSNVTVEKLMVRVGLILCANFVGALIIEEIQHSNFSGSKWTHDMATFFLRLLNFGVPVILIGNPNGFTMLDKYSQIVRRLCSRGFFYMEPYQSKDDFDWKELLVPGIWEFNVMPVKTELSITIRQALYDYSGGISDFLVKLCVESQRIAIRNKEKAVRIEHINQAYQSEIFIKNHNLINGFAKKDVRYLAGIQDVPLEEYVLKWRGIKNNSQIDSTQLTSFAKKQSESSTSKTNIFDKAYSSFKSHQTKAKKKEEKIRVLNSSLEKDDIRINGASSALIDEFQKLKDQTEK